ncbi:carbon-nitrogen hydrolase family protein [Parvularcula maris]|uniref:Carbon-nitrogen hydrolase family protein n=1 Tax=Parvularcula maris TaxID=2965077 RepID=A0A9X2L7L0_9PROT|nr:carbon-nitrogen hydrolase family protein [Parvularcula maris]MCQ8184549.1 carbon-nitrogen hydrolase family protein [Parvularcula maris]
MSKHIVAVAQGAGPMFDLRGTIERFGEILTEAKASGAELVVFPEAFIGGYPKGIDFGLRLGSRSDEGREMFRLYAESCPVRGDETFRELSAVVAEEGVAVCLGLIEREGGTLYCSAVFFERNGEIKGIHRKLVPTALERCVWGRGSAADLPVPELSVGKACSAICWENYMPLLRAHYAAQAPNFYCAPTVDDRDVWLPTMQHIALETRSFVLSACQHLRRGQIDVPGYEAVQGNSQDTVLIRGGSMIVSPMGEVLAGPLYGEDGVLVAEIDKQDLLRARFDMDNGGHYTRPDVFTFGLRR